MVYLSNYWFRSKMLFNQSKQINNFINIKFNRLCLLSSLCAFMLILSGCEKNQVTLVENISQDNANDIILLLGNSNITAQKEFNKKENSYKVLVPENQQLAGLTVLKNNGQPEKAFANLGQVFKKESFISSPLEEHGRFLYALDQEIQDMLSEVNGVVSVKTKVSLPIPNDNLWQGESAKPSASVLIKYRQGERVDLYINRIKNLVSNAVPGLTPDRVEVLTVLQKTK